jgi:hypothetical protein
MSNKFVWQMSGGIAADLNLRLFWSNGVGLHFNPIDYSFHPGIPETQTFPN